MRFFSGKHRYYFIENGNGEAVMLLHGLFMGSFIMKRLAKALGKADFSTVAYDYRTTEKEVPELGRELARFLNSMDLSGFRRVHFVTHSMGALVLRAALPELKEQVKDKIGRTVMIVPPNRGSDMAALALRIVPYAGKIVATLEDLSSAPESFANTFPEPSDRWEIGVLAGTYDLEVKISQTHLKREKAHRTLRATHTGILFRNDTAQEVIHFLQQGKFREHQP